MKTCVLPVAFSLALALVPAIAHSADFTRTEDVVYGRKDGAALTLDVFTPKEQNGAGIVVMVSGGWHSSHDHINPGFYEEYLKRGYTVFAVVHGSQPRYAIPDAVADVNRAVRFIRTHASKYGVDPNRLGVTGGSAGGHLSLMLGCAGSEGNPTAKDPIDRASSRVQAVACFFPPTDFFNYGEPGKDALGRGTLSGFHAPFDFKELDPQKKEFVSITDEAKINEIGHQISPFYQITSDDAPTLIIHGDADKLVPIQQAEIVIAKLKELNVPADLVVKKGAAHGWANMGEDVKTLADWFDKHLGKKDKG